MSMKRNWRAARRKSTRNARKVMVGRGNWNELQKEVVRREDFDREFAPIIRDAANVMYEPDKYMKKVFKGVPSSELSQKFKGSSKSNRRQRQRQKEESKKQDTNEMDTATFLAMWDQEQQSSSRFHGQDANLSPSGMAFHLKQGYTLQFAMGDSMFADSVTDISPYDHSDAVNVFNIGNIADKFFEPRRVLSPRPRPPPNTATSKRGGGSAGPWNLSPRQKRHVNESPEESQRWLEKQNQKFERHVNKKISLRDRRKKKLSHSRQQQNRKNHSNLRELKSEAAAKIQAMYRGKLAREAYESFLVQYDATCLIQALIRGKAVRMEFTEMHDAAICIQAYVRGGLVRSSKSGRWGRRRRQRGNKYNSHFGNNSRKSHGNISNKLKNKREIKSHAATKIQALQRGRVARAQVEMLEDENDAAISIQAHLRGKAVRMEIEEMHTAASKIQAYARGQMIRNGFRPKENIVPPTMRNRGGFQQTGKTSNSLRTFKSSKPGKKGTNDKSLQEIQAATKIQAFHRGNMSREYIEDLVCETDAATLIQSQIRGKAVRLEHKEMNQAAITIQKRTRGNQSRARTGDNEEKEVDEKYMSKGVVELVRCLAIHDFETTEEGDEANDLTFEAGQYIIATDTSDDWWIGYLEATGPNGKTGYFPRNYVQLVHDK
jgi:hypothetical protein